MKWGVIALGVVALLFVRTFFEARSNFEIAEQLVKEAGLEKAAPYYSRAIRWRFPFSPFATVAFEKLSACGFSDECSERNLALSALKQGVMSSRSFVSYQSDNELLSRIREYEIRRQGEPAVKISDTLRWNPWYQILAQLSLWSWLVSIGYVIFSCTSKEGDIIVSRAAKGGGVALLFFCLWLLFLRLA